jgi:HEAT repeat protein
LCASLDRFPQEIALRYLRRFLRDKSERVRGTVVNVAVKAGYVDLIPDFEALLKQPIESEHQEALKEAVALLRGETYKGDGWQARKLSDGSIEYSED